MPREVAEMTVVNADVESVEKAGDVDLVFSALPSSAAGLIEEEFAKKYPVFSKASAHRLDEDTPLLIPEVNPDHLDLIPAQKKRRKWSGFLSTDPNCSTIQLVMTLKPLAKFGLKKVVVSTMQALSGAGYPGVASLDIIDNVVPYIPKEEEKIELETLKILGTLSGETIRPADIEKLKLPSAPQNPIIVRDEPSRPQPRLDRDAGEGMSVVVGRIRHDPVLTLKYLCLGHNTIRGAAGAGLLSAELAVKKGYA